MRQPHTLIAQLDDNSMENINWYWNGKVEPQWQTRTDSKGSVHLLLLFMRFTHLYLLFQRKKKKEFAIYSILAESIGKRITEKSMSTWLGFDLLGWNGNDAKKRTNLWAQNVPNVELKMLNSMNASIQCSFISSALRMNAEQKRAVS